MGINLQMSFIRHTGIGIRFNKHLNFKLIPSRRLDEKFELIVDLCWKHNLINFFSLLELSVWIFENVFMLRLSRW